MAVNPYTSVSVPATYNQSPPSDDGSPTTANKVLWATHTGKIGDPLKTFIENVNTNMVAAGALLINTGIDQANTMSGALGFAKSTLTISGGAVTATRSYHVIAAESGTADNLDTISTSLTSGTLLLIEPDSGDTITVRHSQPASPKILLSDDADFAMSAPNADKLLLVSNGTDWEEVSRSPRTAATQAQQEAGAASTVFVTPAVQQHHRSAAKAWLSFDASSGTPSPARS